MARTEVGVALLAFTLMVLDVTLASDPIIQTTNGKVRGFTTTANSQKLNVFLGIPFAKPPVGKLRFQPPQKIENWQNIKDAMSFPSSCFGTVDTSFEQFEGVDMWNPNTEMSEDCLYLNIWAPKRRPANTKLSTLVWIYGGGFSSGTSTLDWYDGRNLASQNNVIVASMNYRLGALGFLYIGGHVRGNMGLLDQQLALEWIQNNIERFGGDSNSITLFGESAGAFSVSYHLLAPKSWDYFSRGILQSGSATSKAVFYPREQATKRTEKIAGSVQCPNESQQQMLNCLMQIDPALLSETSIGPTVDGVFITDSPNNLVKTGQYKKASILAGFNKNEGIYFVPYMASFYADYLSRPIAALEVEPILTTDQYLQTIDEVVFEVSTTDQKNAVRREYEYSLPSELRNYNSILDNIVGDARFKCPVIDLAVEYAKTSDVNVYVYSFEHVTENNLWPEWMGVLHGYEIDYVFGVPTNTSRGYTTEERELSRRIMTFWTNFAKTGDPNKASVNSPSTGEWPRFTPGTQAYIILDSPALSTGVGPRYRQCAFWREVVPTVERMSGCSACSASSASGSSTSIYSASQTSIAVLVAAIRFISQAHF